MPLPRKAKVHAALLYSCPLIQAHSPPTRLPGWKVDPLMKDNRYETMGKICTPVITTKEDLHEATEHLMQITTDTANSLFPKRFSSS